MLTKSLFKIDSQRERVNQDSRVVGDLHHRNLRERFCGHTIGYLCAGYRIVCGCDAGRSESRWVTVSASDYHKLLRIGSEPKTRINGSKNVIWHRKIAFLKNGPIWIGCL